MRAGIVKNLCDVSVEERVKFLSSIDTIFSDCDGVVWSGLGIPIAGSGDVVNAWRGLDRKIYFTSNNSTKSTARYQQQFKQCNVTIEKEDLIHPSLSMIQYLKSINFTKRCFGLVSPAFVDEMEEAGFKICKPRVSKEQENREYLFTGLHMDEDIGAVILDFDFGLSYMNLMNCIRLLTRPDVLFLVGATDTKLHATPTFVAVGPGYFMDILISITGRQPTLLGKPGKPLADIIKKQYAITKPERALFIGDMLEQDMAFGTLCGFQKLLVLTGGTTLEELNNCTIDEQLPDYYVNSIADLLPIINSISEVKKTK